MTYLDQWRALSSRIRGLREAGHLHAMQSGDSHGRSKRLREHCEGVLVALKTFRGSFQQVLPPGAVAAIDGFLERPGPLTRDTPGVTSDALRERVWAALVFLVAFETEMSFLLSDVQASIRARSERAFSHLQRSIAVDESIRARWLKAFEKGEVACEKLGAVHLLLHGIWAFKVDAAGARTDLVFEEPAGDVTAVQRYAEGLVLTEWKKAAKDGQSVKKFAAARVQARRYAQGLLTATELAGYRYAVVVSRSQVEIPDDMTEDGVVYRHINIAVDPRTPSRR
jgi:hypothetical protein